MEFSSSLGGWIIDVENKVAGHHPQPKDNSTETRSFVSAPVLGWKLLCTSRGPARPPRSILALESGTPKSKVTVRSLAEAR
jgi:hypothetical protein